MSNNSDILKKRLLEALEISLGVVTQACKNAEVSRKTFYQYCQEDLEFKESVDEIQDVALDFAETALHKQIKDGTPSSTMFYLKTKGKKRGYIERLETENTNKNTDLTITPEEREQMIKELRDKL